ncbi:MAG: hypothetical protein A2Z88_08695 [Omnitrophica WOR_2 bacterium GWA2_47_8]|nr:MAG: hypothetical protein A2Z88_08695 [Omnitrophica WOR_2 bacterium GWA2_47_8]
MQKRNRKGFTLLEIIIVAIIIAVLASLALPRFLTTVQNTYQSEGWQNISAVRGAIHRCNTINNDYQLCDQFQNLDVPDPQFEAGAHFTYGILATQNTFAITATRNSLAGGSTANSVKLLQNDGTSVIQRSGTTIWSGV